MVYFLTTQISVPITPITLLIKSPDPPSKVHPILRVPVPASLRYHPGLASPPQDSDRPTPETRARKSGRSSASVSASCLSRNSSAT